MWKSKAGQLMMHPKVNDPRTGGPLLLQGVAAMKWKLDQVSGSTNTIVSFKPIPYPCFGRIRR
jgi:hypothetical protein